MLKIVLILWFSLFVTGNFKAQDSLILGDLIRTEFTLPQSAAFDLLGVSPAQILTPSNIKEFKVDWSFSNWRSSPNLAIQAQPIWEIFYNRPNLAKYRRANYFMRTLSTLDISAGTIEDFNGQRKLATALKINLYRSKDPLVDRKLYKDLELEYNESTKELRTNVYKTKQRLKYLKKQEAQDSLHRVLDSLQYELNVANNLQKEQIKERVVEFQVKNWNSSNVELSIGKAFTFNDFNLDSLNLKGEAVSGWLNGGIGVGKKTLLTGLVKFTLLEHEDIGNQGNAFSFGLNFRYGSPKYHFFSEGLYTRVSNSIWLIDEFNITRLAIWSFGIGGDWRINRNVVLSYGIRTNVDEEFNVIRFIPAAGISCLMR